MSNAETRAVSNATTSWAVKRLMNNYTIELLLFEKCLYNNLNNNVTIKIDRTSKPTHYFQKWLFSVGTAGSDNIDTIISKELLSKTYLDDVRSVMQQLLLQFYLWRNSLIRRENFGLRWNRHLLHLLSQFLLFQCLISFTVRWIVFNRSFNPNNRQKNALFRTKI